MYYVAGVGKGEGGGLKIGSNWVVGGNFLSVFFFIFCLRDCREVQTYFPLAHFSHFWSFVLWIEWKLVFFQWAFEVLGCHNENRTVTWQYVCSLGLVPRLSTEGRCGSKMSNPATERGVNLSYKILRGVSYFSTTFSECLSLLQHNKWTAPNTVNTHV